MKRAISIRLSDPHKLMLDQLCEKLGISQRVLIEMLLSEKHDKEFPECPTAPSPSRPRQ